MCCTRCHLCVCVGGGSSVIVTVPMSIFIFSFCDSVRSAFFTPTRRACLVVYVIGVLKGALHPGADGWSLWAKRCVTVRCVLLRFMTCACVLSMRCSPLRRRPRHKSDCDMGSGTSFGLTGHCYEVALNVSKNVRCVRFCISSVNLLLAELVADRLVPPKGCHFSAELVADRLVLPKMCRFLAELVADRLVPPDWSTVLAELVAHRLVLPLSNFGYCVHCCCVPSFSPLHCWILCAWCGAYIIHTVNTYFAF